MDSRASSPILGFDVGGTKTSVVVGTPAGTVLERVARPSNASAGFNSMWATMVSSAEELISRWGQPAAIGVSIGGPLDSDRGIVHSPPNLPGWDEIPLKKLLTERFGAPTYVEHDARAGALAEWMFGAAKGATDVVYLTFGTGLGAGMILGGRLYRGSDSIAGEVGHWRMLRRGPRAYGKAGSWEALSSGAGMPQLARYLYPKVAWPEDLSARTLVRLATDGDPRASAVVRVAAGWLGRGIAQLVDLLNPQIVVVGSLAVRAGDLFLPTARRVVDRECLAANRRCSIVASALGDEAGDVAALCAAIYQAKG